MKKVYSVIAAVLFAVIYPFALISSSYNTGDFYFGNHSAYFIYLKYTVIFIVIFILTYLNRNEPRLFHTYAPLVLCAVSVAVYYDYFITGRYLQNYSYILWLGVVMTVTNTSLFTGATLFLKEDYKLFYKRFWMAFLIIYLLIFYVSFIREPNSFELTVNNKIGNGTFKYFKAVFNDPKNNLYTFLICFGNFFVTVPIPFIISSFKKLPLPVMIGIGISIPLLCEGYQYYFECGNVDIDDIILNIAGYMLALAVQVKIYKTKLKA